MFYYDYLGLNSDYAYQEYVQPSVEPSITNIEGGNTIITTINGGGGGQATGNTVTISGGTTGLTFTAANNTITLSGTLGISNGGSGATTAAGARANFGAAASGVNADITMFTGLAGSGGWNAWTGTSDKTSHATFSGTASVGYVQAELQAVMDKLKETTETLKGLLDTLLASGVIKL